MGWLEIRYSPQAASEAAIRHAAFSYSTSDLIQYTPPGIGPKLGWVWRSGGGGVDWRSLSGLPNMAGKL